MVGQTESTEGEGGEWREDGSWKQKVKVSNVSKETWRKGKWWSELAMSEPSVAFLRGCCKFWEAFILRISSSLVEQIVSSLSSINTSPDHQPIPPPMFLCPFLSPSLSLLPLPLEVLNLINTVHLQQHKTSSAGRFFDLLTVHCSCRTPLPTPLVFNWSSLKGNKMQFLLSFHQKSRKGGGSLWKC